MELGVELSREGEIQERHVMDELEYEQVLAPELWHHVLSFVGWRTLLACCLVSRRFYALANDGTLWKRLCAARWRVPVHELAPLHHEQLRRQSLARSPGATASSPTIHVQQVHDRGDADDDDDDAPHSMDEPTLELLSHESGSRHASGNMTITLSRCTSATTDLKVFKRLRCRREALSSLTDLSPHLDEHSSFEHTFGTRLSPNSRDASRLNVDGTATDRPPRARHHHLQHHDQERRHQHHHDDDDLVGAGDHGKTCSAPSTPRVHQPTNFFQATWRGVFRDMGACGCSRLPRCQLLQSSELERNLTLAH